MTSKSIFLVFLAVPMLDLVSLAQVDRAVLEGAGNALSSDHVFCLACSLSKVIVV